MTGTADVVVVGAGVIGSSVALALARRGLDVLVVDRNSAPGLGSTSASSAIIRFNYSTHDGVATAWEAYHCWQDWPAFLGGSMPPPLARHIKTGLVMLDVPVAPRPRVLALFDQVGVPYEEWDSATLRSKVAGIDTGVYWPNKRLDDPAFWEPPTGQLGAFFTPDAGFVDDPQLAAVNLAAAAGRNGARFAFGRGVVAVRTTGGRVSGIDLDDGDQVDTPVVVNVAGPWSGALNRLAGVGAEFGADWSVDVRPLRQEVHHVPAPPGFNSPGLPGPVVADLDLGTYLRGAPGDGLLVGGTEPECDGLMWLDDPDACDPHPTAALFRAQVTRAARRLTTLGVPNTARGVVGVYDVTPDWTPIYDRTELDGFYVAIGTSGNQFKNAPLAGRFLAQIITAVEGGHDHDGAPLRHVGEHTGAVVDLGAFSRRRARNADSSGTVIG